jgi:hypothetical protein
LTGPNITGIIRAQTRSAFHNQSLVWLAPGTGPADYTGMSKGRVLRLLRWIAVIPMAVIGAGLVANIALSFSELSPTWFPRRASFPAELGQRSLEAVFYGGGMVFLAAAMAPSHKSHVAVFIAGMFVAGSAITCYLAFDGLDWWDIYQVVLGAVAAVVMCVSIIEDTPLSDADALADRTEAA